MKVLLIIFKNLFFIGVAIYLFSMTVVLVDAFDSPYIAKLVRISVVVIYIIMLVFSFYIFRKLNNTIEDIYDKKGGIAFLVLLGWILLYIFVNAGLCFSGVTLVDMFRTTHG